jgi:multicomponent Na+:H+ antiporter subunit D
MSATTTLVFILAVPFLTALAVALTGSRPNLRDALTVLGGIILFALVGAIAPAVSGGDRPEVLLVSSFRLVLRLEPLGFLFAMVASGLWIVTSFYSFGYMRAHKEGHQTRFFTCFAIAIGAAMGVATAGNLITLFVFYEMLTLSTYPLVTHHGTDDARKAGRVYLGILLSTSIGFLLFAIIATYALAGTLEFRDGGILSGTASDTAICALMLLYAFGIGKAALMPFHRWLPAAMVAPTPVSALLHAVAVVKAGVFSVLKIAVYVFGVDLLKDSGAGLIPMYVAGFTIVAASMVALAKDNLKARLAYSTISQLSYIVLGAMLASGLGIVGGGMHIVMHAFGKITLFFCAGAIYVTAHKTLVSQLDGLGRTMPFTFAAFGVASLSIIGLPPLGGSWSKWYLALGSVDSGHAILVAVLMVSSLLNIAYLLPIPIRGFFFRSQETSHGEAPALCVVPLCITAVVSVLLFFHAEKIFNLLKPIAGL